MFFNSKEGRIKGILLTLGLLGGFWIKITPKISL